MSVIKQLGNASFNISGFVAEGLTEEGFMLRFKGKLNFDINGAWKVVSKEMRKLSVDKPVDKSEKKVKKQKRKRK